MRGIKAAILVCLIIAPIAALMYFQKPWLAQTRSDREEVILEPASFDLGMLDQHSVATHTFSIYNGSRSLCRIVAATPQCGCTILSIPDQDILPRSNGSVRVSFRTMGLPAGRFSKHVALRYAIQDSNRVVDLELRITGQINASNAVSGFPGIVDFGELSQIQPINRSIYVRADRKLLDQLPDDVMVKWGESLEIRVRLPSGPSEISNKKIAITAAPSVEGEGSEPSSSLRILNAESDDELLVIPIRGRRSFRYRGIPSSKGDNSNTAPVALTDYRRSQIQGVEQAETSPVVGEIASSDETKSLDFHANTISRIQSEFPSLLSEMSLHQIPLPVISLNYLYFRKIKRKEES